MPFHLSAPGKRHTLIEILHCQFEKTAAFNDSFTPSFTGSWQWLPFCLAVFASELRLSLELRRNTENKMSFDLAGA